MKKIYLLLMLLMVGVAANAQRKLVFEVSIDTPYLNQNIITGSTTLPVYNVKNVSLTDADSLGAGESFDFISPQSSVGTGGLPVAYNRITMGAGGLKKGATIKLNPSGLGASWKVPFDSIKTLIAYTGAADTIKVKPFTSNKQYNWYLEITNVSYLLANPTVTSLSSNRSKKAIWINKTTGVSEISFEEPNAIKTFPNPAANQLSFEYNFETSEKATATIMDVTGRTVMVKEFEGAVGNRKYDLDINAIPTGTYLMRLNVGEKSNTVKFNVQK